MGVGNVLMKDDGVGVHAVRCILSEDLAPGIEVIEAGIIAAQAVSDFASIRRMIVIDAIDADGPPGAVYRIPAAEIPRTQTGISLHHTSISDALCAWQLQGLDLRRVVIIGVQPARVEPGEKLTEIMQCQLPLICRAAVAEALPHAHPARKGR